MTKFKIIKAYQQKSEDQIIKKQNIEYQQMQYDLMKQQKIELKNLLSKTKMDKNDTLMILKKIDMIEND